MKSFLVIGIGRFGSNLARTLFDLGYEVLALDENEERIEAIADHVTHAVVGNPCDEEILKSVGARNFDCAIVSMSEDSQHFAVLVTLLLKEMGVQYVVAKATSDTHKRVLEKVGADKVVFPERDMSIKLASSLVSTKILDYINLSNDFTIAEINVPEKWEGKTLASLNLRTSSGINVIAIKNSQDKKINVSIDPEYKFHKSDIVVVSGKSDDVKELTED